MIALSYFVISLFFVLTDVGGISWPPPTNVVDTVITHGVVEAYLPPTGLSVVSEVDFGRRPSDTICVDTTLLISSKSLRDTLQISSITALNNNEFTIIAPKLPHTLAPGESLAVTLRFCPPKDSSCRSDSINIVWMSTLDTTDQAVTSLLVRGCGPLNTLFPITVQPSVIDFGTLALDSCVSDTFEVTNNSGVPISLQALFPVGVGLVQFFPDTFTVAPRGTTFVVARFCPGQRVITFDTTALLLTNPNGGGVTTTIRLRGRSIRLLAPSTIDFGDIPLGFCRDSFVVIRNRAAQSLVRIIGINFPAGNSGFSLTSSSPTIPSFGFDTLHARFCATQGGIATATAVIDTAQGITPVSILLRANVLAGNGLTVTPRILTFDTLSLPRDTCGVKTFWLVNNSTVPVIVDSISLPVGTPFTLVPGVSFPDTLTSGDSLPIIVRFCPTAQGSYQATITLWMAGYSPSTIATNGVATSSNNYGGLLTTLETSVDFGVVLVSNSVLGSITVKNLGPGVEVLSGGAIAPTGSDFTIVSSPPPNDTIPPGESRSILISFSPSVIGTREATWSYAAGGRLLSVQLSGRGVMRSLQLDTTSISVGERTSLRLTITPDLLAKDTVGSITSVVVYPPRALFFHGATMGGRGGLVTTRRIDDSSIAVTISGASGNVITGGHLADLEFTGLTSGRPVNVIALPIDSVRGLDRLGATGNGQVLLNGCDVGRQDPLSRRITIGSVRVASRNSATIVYRAPRNATVTIRLVNTSGQVSARFDLPDGTDEEVHAEIPLDEVAPGLYLLDMRAGADRTTSLILIN